METRTMDLPETLDYAIRAARQMNRKDPEMDSLAGLAAWKAHSTFKPEKDVPYKLWVSYCVRMEVYGYWRELRRRPEVQFSQLDTDETIWTETTLHLTSCDESDSLFDGLSIRDWVILVEHFVHRWPLDVIAKNHCMATEGEASRYVKAAVSRLQHILDN